MQLPGLGRRRSEEFGGWRLRRRKTLVGVDWKNLIPPPCFEDSLFAMDEGWEGIAHENAQVLNNVCDLYGIARISSGKGQLKWMSPFNSDIIAFVGIDREVPIYRPIPDIVEGALQKAAL